MKYIVTIMMAMMLSNTAFAYSWADFEETTVYAWDTTIDTITAPFRNDEEVTVEVMTNPCNDRMAFIREMDTHNGPAVAIIECPAFNGYTLTINKPADDRIDNTQINHRFFQAR